MPRTKTCSRCGQEKPVDAFDPGVFGHPKQYCRACSPAVAAERRNRKREKAKEWARNNREKVRQSAKATYARNRAERLAYYSRWRKENADHVRAYQQDYAMRKRSAAG